MRTFRARKGAPVAVVALLALCGAAGAAGAAGPEEPTGGRWRPIVLAAGSQVPLPVPPAAGSRQQAEELRELQALQAQRTAETRAAVAFWDGGACLRWNEVARGLVIKHRTPPPVAARAYALVSVAQYDALVAAWHHKYRYGRRAPARMDGGIVPIVAVSRTPAYPSEHATVAAASAAVLAYLFPDESAALAALAGGHQKSRLWAGASFPSDITAGDKLGRSVAGQVIAHARTDGSDAVWSGAAPVGEGFWTGTDPLLPLWGGVRPWLMTSGSQFRPGPPPAFGSPEFAQALAEVRHLSDTRTPEQLAIARFWADGAGTYTPPGHWNQIACDLLAERRPGELRSARALALMNLAVMDAGICCWDAKYAYWLIRPSQADPAITTPVGLPNFPAYTSGHSAFSGAAAEVLAYVFPDQAEALRALAEEAAVSRLYGGIHYRFDSEVGLEGGRSVAAFAIERGKADGSP